MNEEMKREHQRPEGRLLERAMTGPPKVSGRKLAKMGHMSEGRVRQIVNGYKTESGMTLPVVAPAETLSRLGDALGLLPSAFEEVGRKDVAEIMRGDISSGVTEEGHLWLADQNELRVALLDWLNQGFESDPPTEPLMLWDMDALLAAAGKKYRDEIHFLNSVLTVSRKPQSDGGDGDADDQGGAAPIERDDFGLAAHDEDHSIEDEQLGDEFP